jgi:hypothetical protein
VSCVHSKSLPSLASTTFKLRVSRLSAARYCPDSSGRVHRLAAGRAQIFNQAYAPATTVAGSVCPVTRAARSRAGPGGSR